MQTGPVLARRQRPRRAPHGPAAQHATSSSVTGMAHQIEAGPSTAGSSKISAPLMTSPRATETKNAAPGLRMA